MTKEQAFEDVSKIIFDRACQLIVGGNPAYESEMVLFHIEMVMTEWGYRSAKVAEYCDSLKQENDIMRDMGMEYSCTKNNQDHKIVRGEWDF